MRYTLHISLNQYDALIQLFSEHHCYTYASFADGIAVFELDDGFRSITLEKYATNTCESKIKQILEG